MKKIEAQLREIETLIAAGQYQASRALYDSIFYELRRSRHEAGDVTLKENRTLGRELDRLQAQVGRAASAQFERLAAQMAEGAPDTLPLQRLVRNFDTVGGVRLREELDRRIPKLDKARRLRAIRWVRLSTEAVDEDFESAVLDHLRKTIALPPGFALAFGPALGPAENLATFATVRTEIQTRYKDYIKMTAEEAKNQSPSYFSHREAHGLLHSLSVSIKVEKATGLGATPFSGAKRRAETVDQISLELMIPQTVSVPSGETPHDYFKRSNREGRADLQAKLSVRLAQMPPLNLSSERGTGPLSLSHALAKREEFVKAARIELPAGRSASTVACIAIELGIEELAGAIEARLPTFPAAQCSEIIESLTARPWYNGTKTLCQLVSTAELGLALLATQALCRDLDLPAVRKTVWDRILKEKRSMQQQSMLEALVAHCPEECIGEVSQIFPSLPAETKSAALTALMKRNRETALSFARSLVEQGQPNVAVEVVEALGSALDSMYNARRRELRSEEVEFFLSLVQEGKGSLRRRLIEKLPDSDDILVRLFELDRRHWSETENLALYERLSRTYHKERYARMIGAVLSSLKAGRYNTPALYAEMDRLLGGLTNQMMKFNQEDVALPLLMVIIDEPLGAHKTIYVRSILQLSSAMQESAVRAHPSGRSFLEKARQHPAPEVQAKVRKLIQEAAKADPTYQPLL